jgi:hypothetical protein
MDLFRRREPVYIPTLPLRRDPFLPPETEDLAPAIEEFLRSLNPSTPDGPVGLVYLQPYSSGAENFRWVVIEPGHHITNGISIPPVPNAAAYVPLSAFNRGNPYHAQIIATLDAAGGYTDIFGGGEGNTLLMDFSNPHTQEAFRAYVNRLVDSGYAAIFFDDHDVMFHASQHPNAEGKQLTAEQIAAARAFTQEIISELRARDIAVIFNGIGDEAMLPFLAQAGAELLVENQIADMGTLREGTGVMPDGGLVQWSLNRFALYADAGGTHLHLVEPVPLNGLDVTASRTVFEPHVAWLQGYLAPAKPNITLYVAEDSNYTALTIQQAPNTEPLQLRPQIQR